MKEILVSVDEFENRVAVLEDGRLMEYYIDRGSKQIGGIYKGKVVNILSGMHSAFIDIGFGKNAFLSVDDLVAKSNAEVEEFESVKKPVSIKDFLKINQDVLVQVVKEAVGDKGPRVTTQITLPGRYLVLNPKSDFIGVSRRIDEQEEKERLKQIAEAIKLHNMGLIIRTVASGKSFSDLKRDLRFLIKLWNRIESSAKKKKSPALVYEEIGLVDKIIRDTFTDEVNKLIVDSVSEYKHILRFLNIISPSLKKRVHLFRKEQNSLFESHGVEKEVEKALRNKMWLPSGGYIIIDETEALTIIDVNTGKYTGKKSLAETILKINLEAASEIMRLVRLRDIGGIIIIDFIDMDSEDDRFKLMSHITEHLKKDHTKTSLIGMSQLGLVQITRKRLGRNLSEFLNEECPYCRGRGKIESVESMCIKLSRLIKEKAFKEKAENVLVKACPKLAVAILGWQGENLKHLEKQIRKSIYVQADPQLHQEKIEFKFASNKHLQKNKLLTPCQEIYLKIEDVFGSNLQSGLGIYQGNLIEVDQAGNLIGKEVKVAITDVYHTYAKGKMI